MRDHRREISRLEAALLDCQNENIDKEKQIKILKKIIDEKDNAIDKIMGGAATKDDQVNLLKQYLKEKDLTIESLITKMDEMKKTIDELTIRELDQLKII